MSSSFSDSLFVLGAAQCNIAVAKAFMLTKLISNTEVSRFTEVGSKTSLNFHEKFVVPVDFCSLKPPLVFLMVCIHFHQHPGLSIHLVGSSVSETSEIRGITTQPHWGELFYLGEQKLNGRTGSCAASGCILVRPTRLWSVFVQSWWCREVGTFDQHLEKCCLPVNLLRERF